MPTDFNNDTQCDPDLIPFYVDGELDHDVQTVLESHLEKCSKCREDLQLHRLFICELDSALANEANVGVPANFSTLVAARAVSDMSGVRTSAENRKALVFCLILALSGIALLGSTRTVVLDLGRKIFGMIFGVIGILWNALYDSILSLTVISRVLSRKFIIETGGAGIVLALFALAVILLKRLISDYHRTGATG